MQRYHQIRYCTVWIATSGKRGAFLAFIVTLACARLHVIYTHRFLLKLRRAKTVGWKISPYVLPRRESLLLKSWLTYTNIQLIWLLLIHVFVPCACVGLRVYSVSKNGAKNTRIFERFGVRLHVCGFLHQCNAC